MGQVGKSFLDMYDLRKGKEPQTGRIQTPVWCASGDFYSNDRGSAISLTA